MNKIKILLADDHKIILEGLRGLLETKYDIVGMAEDGNALVKEALRLKPDVIIADISMPSLNGIDAIRQIRKQGLNPKVIFLTMHNDALYAKEALEIGASAFVLKHSAASELITAVEETLSGNRHISPVISQELSRLDEGNGGNGVFEGLSLRQREVLQLLAEGKSAKEVASILKISPRTVEFHKYSTMQQLGIKTNAEIIHFAIKHGIVSI
ncbi:MAG: DNA-binding response regulator [Planctomycetes bacterium GWF2_42_9]|nr:MAG: DNA-binding response regulator [Planctomycetes bacterium GWF2_42_9]